MDEAISELRADKIDAVDVDAFELLAREDKLKGLQLSLTAHAYAPSLLIVSEQLLATLSTKQQKAFLQAAHAMAEPAFTISEEREEKRLQGLAAVIDLTDFERPSLSQISRAAHDDYEQKYRRRWFDLVSMGRH